SRARIVPVIPASGASPRAGTQDHNLSDDASALLGAGDFADAKFRHDSRARIVPVIPASGASPRAGTQGHNLSGDASAALGAGDFADAKFRHDSRARIVPVIPASGVSPRAGTWGHNLSGDVPAALGAGDFASRNSGMTVAHASFLSSRPRAQAREPGPRITTCPMMLLPSWVPEISLTGNSGMTALDEPEGRRAIPG